MLSNREVRKIHLPPETKAVRDMCILPGGSAIFTSLGRRLSLFRFVLIFRGCCGSYFYPNCLVLCFTVVLSNTFRNVFWNQHDN
jgi:hypothetical protein